MHLLLVGTLVRPILVHLESSSHHQPTYSNTPVSLVVFDSGLKDLKLPILQPTFREELDKLGEEEAKEKRIEYRPDVTPKTLPMPFLAYKYFELVGTFQDGVYSIIQTSSTFLT